MNKEDKRRCRDLTMKALSKLHKLEGFHMEWVCQKCNNENVTCPSDLQIHHEVYSTDLGEIIKLIKNKKIYKLCKKCHKEVHKNGIKTNKK